MNLPLSSIQCRMLMPSFSYHHSVAPIDIIEYCNPVSSRTRSFSAHTHRDHLPSKATLHNSYSASASLTALSAKLCLCCPLQFRFLSLFLRFPPPTFHAVLKYVNINPQLYFGYRVYQLVHANVTRMDKQASVQIQVYKQVYLLHFVEKVQDTGREMI